MFRLTEVLRRAGDYFMERSPIHQAARRIVTALEGMNIPYAIAGALAVNAHGHLRTSEDVDLLLAAEGLQAFKGQWLGRGWTETFPGSRGLRDTETGIRIDVLLAGDFPGDGKPKPVAFPDPRSAAERTEDGFAVVPLRTLLELKIASGMTAPHRPRDLDDAIQLIRANHLTTAYGETLNPYVREKFRDLWQAAQVREDY